MICLSIHFGKLVLIAYAARRLAGEGFELAAEEVGVAVAEGVGDGADGHVGFAEELAGAVEAGLDDEVVGRDIHAGAEAAGELGWREAGAAGHFFDRPVGAGVFADCDDNLFHEGFAFFLVGVSPFLVDVAEHHFQQAAAVFAAASIFTMVGGAAAAGNIREESPVAELEVSRLMPGFRNIIAAIGVEMTGENMEAVVGVLAR